MWAEVRSSQVRGFWIVTILKKVTPKTCHNKRDSIILTMKRHFFFDMDGTLTRSRSRINDSMVERLRDLLKKGADVVVVSGATKLQINKQIGEIMNEVIVMSQNGNHTELPTGEILWRNELTATQKDEVLGLVCKMIDHANLKVCDPSDLVEDRVCQISYSLIGHNAPLEDKEEADPNKVIRKNIIGRFEEDLAELNELGVQARIGGTTCIDFTICHKGDNVRRIVEEMGWEKDECVYVGDALFEGGNDHSVVGVIPTCAVFSHVECEEAIRSFIRELSI